MNVHPLLVGGARRSTGATLPVINPYDGRPFAEVALGRPDDIEDALAAAERAFESLRRLPAWRRAEILRSAADRLEGNVDGFARTIVAEAGKPLAQARAEVQRAVLTLRTSAEEAVRIGGDLLPLDLTPGSDRRFGIVRRFPVGPVACITPFNFPLNLVAHKVAPALAAGCPFVLKPASKTPLSALALADLLLSCGAPEEAVSVLPLRGADATPLVEDDRVRALSFTGSAAVGWELKRRAFKKKVVLELGGNAGVIVDRGADVEASAGRICAGGFAYAGQSCVSVQRIFVHREVHERFVAGLLARVAALVIGDPMDPRTDVGPMIDLEDALRIEAWIGEAVDGGAKILAGGTRDGAFVAPTVLTATRPEMKVRASEAFAPVVVVEAFDEIAEAIRAVDASAFGLQAGIFTADLGAALDAFEGIEAGAVLVNEVPTWRSDPMPYGGVKESGTGREGPRWAIDDYTEPRLLVLAR